MRKLVVDASIAVQWTTKIRENDVKMARAIYAAMLDRKVELYAPTFLLVEILNVLARKKKVNSRSITKILKELVYEGVHFISQNPEDIFLLKRIALKYHTTAYDGLYLLLAKQHRCKLVTVDEKLSQIKRWTIGLHQVQLT